MKICLETNFGWNRAKISRTLHEAASKSVIAGDSKSP